MIGITLTTTGWLNVESQDRSTNPREWLGQHLCGQHLRGWRWPHRHRNGPESANAGSPIRLHSHWLYHGLLSFELNFHHIVLILAVVCCGKYGTAIQTAMHGPEAAFKLRNELNYKGPIIGTDRWFYWILGLFDSHIIQELPAMHCRRIFRIFWQMGPTKLS